jgi:mRNA interferase MazF
MGGRKLQRAEGPAAPADRRRGGCSQSVVTWRRDMVVLAPPRPARSEVDWADLGPPARRQPVCVLTRAVAIDVLRAVTCAPITRTKREIRSEVELGREQGLSDRCVIAFDNISTVPKGASDADGAARAPPGVPCDARGVAGWWGRPGGRKRCRRLSFVNGAGLRWPSTG